MIDSQDIYIERERKRESMRFFVPVGNPLHSLLGGIERWRGRPRR